MTEVSVIIPTYNRAHVLKRAIQSVLDQTYPDFELIIVDDGSEDNTEETVKAFRDQRIIYIRHDRNRGGSAARNTAIKSARGKYIAFQDSDDEWVPEKLEKQMKVFRDSSPEVGVVYSGFFKWEKTQKVYIPSPWVIQREDSIHGELLKGNFVGAPSAVVRKECFQKMGGFDEEIPVLEDWELWIRISKYYQFRYVNEPLLVSYYSEGGVNEQDDLILARTLELIVEKHLEDFRENKRLLSHHYYTMGVLCLGTAQGRSYLVKALRLNPFNLKLIVAAGLAFLGRKPSSMAVKVFQRIRRVRK